MVIRHVKKSLLIQLLGESFIIVKVNNVEAFIKQMRVNFNAHCNFVIIITEQKVAHCVCKFVQCSGTVALLFVRDMFK